MYENFDAAVQDLYDSIAEPDRWTNALDKLSDALKVTGCLFLSRDESMAIPHAPASNDISGFIDAFMKEEWYKRDQTAARGWPLLGRDGRFVILDDHVTTAEERRQSDYYQDFRFRWDLPHWAAIGFSSNDNERCLTVLRNGRQGEFAASDINQFEILRPHLSRLSHMANIIGKMQVTSSIGILDRMDQAACLVGWSGNVIALNERAETLLDSEFFLSGGRLFSADARSNQKLQNLLDAVTFRGFETGRATYPGATRVERRERRPVIIQAMPLSGKMLGVFSPATALLLFTDLERPASLSTQIFKQVWGMTEAEAKIVVELCRGLSLEETAAKLGIAKETARKQIKACFEKVGVHRQSELVAQARLVPTIKTP